MLIFNFLEEFQISPLFPLFIYNSRNFLDFSLSNYSVTVALLCFIFVMIINVFSFFYEVNLLIQTNVSNGLDLAVAAIQAIFINLILKAQVLSAIKCVGC
jgi:hypothetical protein